MDTEILKQLVDIFKQLTDGAIYALIAYMGYMYVKLFLFFGAVFYLIKTIAHVVTGAQLPKKVAAVVGFDDYDGSYYADDKKLLDKVRAAVKAAK